MEVEVRFGMNTNFHPVEFGVQEIRSRVLFGLEANFQIFESVEVGALFKLDAGIHLTEVGVRFQADANIHLTEVGVLYQSQADIYLAEIGSPFPSGRRGPPDGCWRPIWERQGHTRLGFGAHPALFL